MIAGEKIIHYADHNQRYLCNQAVNPTPEKLAIMFEKITCKNCLRILEKEQPKK